MVLRIIFAFSLLRGWVSYVRRGVSPELLCAEVPGTIFVGGAHSDDTGVYVCLDFLYTGDATTAVVMA